MCPCSLARQPNNPELIKGSWTRAEDEIIIEFVHQYGTKNWTKLANLLPGRIGKQCRERWRNHLDPSNKKGEWTMEEDSLLIKYHELYGNQWVKIASMIPGRSDNSIKNRWNSTLKKNPRQIIECHHQTPTNCGDNVDIPYTPGSNEVIPKPNIIEDSFDNSNSTFTPKNSYDSLQSPFIGRRSPFTLCSPSFKNPILMSPWNDTPKQQGDYLFSPRFGFNNENREPNLRNLL